MAPQALTRPLATVFARYRLTSLLIFSLVLLGSSANRGQPLTPLSGGSPGSVANRALRPSAVKLTPSGSGYSESILYRFQGLADGKYPQGTLVADEAGSLYGTTFGGRLGHHDVVFKLTPSGSGYVQSVIHTFKGPPDGERTASGLVADKTGALYGTTLFGGSGRCRKHGCGTVFKLTPSASGYAERILYNFHGPPDGAQPTADLLIDSAGVLYGTTVNGGASPCTGGYKPGCGTAFALTPSGSGYSETIMYRFQGGGSDGRNPPAGLIEDASGAFFGTMIGTSGQGGVFKLTRSGSGYMETVLYTFRGGQDGAGPQAGLIEDGTGALYGTTFGGGSKSDLGTVFKLAPSASGYTESVLYRFTGGSDGSKPEAGLISDKTGALYGTTLRGYSNFGAVFKLTPSRNGYTESVLHTFTTGGDGTKPYGGLILDKTGALYGTTSHGGGTPECRGSYSGCGTVFKLTPFGS